MGSATDKRQDTTLSKVHQLMPLRLMDDDFLHF